MSTLRYNTSAFDTLLACLIPLAAFLVFLRSAPLTWKDLRSLLSLGALKKPSSGPFSLTRAHQAYAQYVRLASYELRQKRASFGKLGPAHRRLANKIGYGRKLDAFREVIDLNAAVTKEIANLAVREFEFGVEDAGGAVNQGDVGRVVEALKHFARDWSAEGEEERKKIFEPVLAVLAREDPVERRKKKVLIPGCGLGRLAWEIAELGYDTTANELSYFMILALRFLLSPETTTTVDQHTVYPFAHWFSHQRSNDSTFRPIPFPDVVPRLSPKFHLLETDFFTIPVPASTPKKATFWSKSDTTSRKQSLENTDCGYDYIVTLFFLDTSVNVIATIQHIHALLRPGGTWINLGPLLWMSSEQTRLELSLEEVLQAVQEVGFKLHDTKAGEHDDDVRRRRSVDCEYTRDVNAMMRWIYKAEFWVAIKTA